MFRPIAHGSFDVDNGFDEEEIKENATKAAIIYCEGMIKAVEGLESNDNIVIKHNGKLVFLHEYIDLQASILTELRSRL